jgi:outer membrane protein TolC
MRFALALLLTAAPMAATAQTRVESIVKPVEAPALDIKDNAVLLSLDEAVQIALQQNLGLVVQRYTREQARLAVEQNLGIYDLLATSSLSASSASTATTDQTQASQSKREAFNFGFDQLLPVGGTFSLGWENSRRESNSIFTQLNPAYNSNLTFEYIQPLLRGFGDLPTEHNLLLARKRNDIGRQEFERQIVDITQQVINAYWNLVAAREQLVVAQQSLDLAKELHERNRIQVQVGTLAPLELVQSEAAIAERDEGIIQASSNVGDAEDVLRRLLNLPDGPLWETPIRPTTDPVVEHKPIDVEASIQTALAERPELRSQQLSVEQAEIDARFFRQAMKPRLDLDVTYGLSGTGGTTLVRDPDTGEVIRTVAGGFGDAFSQVTGLDFDGWTAALNFSLPIQNRAARAQSAIADLDVSSSQTALEDLRKQIITEVRQAARRVDTAAKQIDAAAASTKFQERNLEAERKRYENGMSTSFQITQIQDDLTQARSREVNAVIEYRNALAAYYRATGRLLDEENITVEDQGDVPVRRGIFSFRRR